MSIQEMKTRIHQLVDEIKDETLLEEINQLLLGSADKDILNDLTHEQLAGLEEARREAQQGKGMPLTDFKHKMESKWPQLKSL